MKSLARIGVQYPTPSPPIMRPLSRAIGGMRVLRAAFTVVVACGGAACASDRAKAAKDSARSTVPAARTASHAPMSGAVVLTGEAGDDSFRRAWIVVASGDSAAKKGGIVFVTDSASSCVSLNATTLHWAGRSGVVRYEYTGHRVDSTWVGVLRTIDVEHRDSLRSADTLRLRAVGGVQESAIDSLVHRFSSSEINEESGDLVGTDLLLVGRGESTQAVVAFNQGAPGQLHLYRAQHVRADSSWLVPAFESTKASAAGQSGEPRLLVVRGANAATVVANGARERLPATPLLPSRELRSCGVHDARHPFDSGT